MDDAIRKGLEADDAMGQDAAEPLRTRIAQLEAELALAKGPTPATPAPGPSAEGEWIVAESEGGASVGVGVYRSTDGENTRPLVYFGYEEQGTDDEDEAIRRANQRARAVAAALNALTRAPGGQDAE